MNEIASVLKEQARGFSQSISQSLRLWVLMASKKCEAGFLAARANDESGHCFPLRKPPGPDRFSRNCEKEALQEESQSGNPE